MCVCCMCVQVYRLTGGGGIMLSLDVTYETKAMCYRGMSSSRVGRYSADDADYYASAVRFNATRKYHGENQITSQELYTRRFHIIPNKWCACGLENVPNYL